MNLFDDLPLSPGRPAVGLFEDLAPADFAEASDEPPLFADLKPADLADRVPPGMRATDRVDYVPPIDPVLEPDAARLRAAQAPMTNERRGDEAANLRRLDNFQRPQPYRNRREAIDDAVNLIDEGHEPKSVYQAFSALLKPAEIERARIERRRGADIGPPQVFAPRDPETAATGTIGPAPDPGIGRQVVDTAVRGAQAAGRAFDVLGHEVGTLSSETAARRIAGRQHVIDQHAPPEGVQQQMQAIGEAQTFGDAARALWQNPHATLTMLGESVIASTPALVGAAAGSVFGPAGTAAGAGAGSLALEFGSSVIDYLQDKGLDPRNPAHIEALFNDPMAMQSARSYAARRGIPVAAFDALSAGIAGRFVRGPIQRAMSGQTRGATAARQIAAGGAAETGLQAGTGMAGEATGQFATGQFRPADILLEGLAEVPGGAVEAGLNVRTHLRGDAHAIESALRHADRAAILNARSADDALRAAAVALKRPDPMVDQLGDLVGEHQRLQAEAVLATQSEAARGVGSPTSVAGAQRPVLPAPQSQGATESDTSLVPLASDQELLRRVERPLTKSDDGTLLKADGTPWADRSRAEQAARANPGHEVVNLGRGYALRPAPPIQASVDNAAHEAATSPLNDRPEPTTAQREAGNYQKGRVTINGLPVVIENPESSVRSGISADGRPWQTTMRSHYGYLARSEGKDGDQVDVFVRPGTAVDHSGPVFIVDQIDPQTGRFDEAKVMLGWPDEASARAAYLENYEPGWQGLGNITRRSFEDFRVWLQSGDTRKPLGAIPSAPSPSPRYRATTEPEQREPQARVEAEQDGSDGLLFDAQNQPFRSRARAQIAADKLGHGRVVRVEGRGWAIEPNPPREIRTRVRRPGANVRNPVLRAIAEAGGISRTHFRELTGEPYSPQMAMRLGLSEVFTRNGRSIDLIADEVLASRFLTRTQIDDPRDTGGTRAAAELIGEAIARRSDPSYRPPQAMADEEAEFERLRDRAIGRMAETEPEGREAEAELLAERAAIQAEADALENELTPRDVAAFLEPGEAASAETLRLLGFTDDEIATLQSEEDSDALGTEGSRKTTVEDARGATGEGRRRTGPPEGSEDRRLSESASADRRRREPESGMTEAEAGLIDGGIVEPRKRGSITDAGERIGGARKDTSTRLGTTAPKPESEDPGWRRRYEVSQIAKSARPEEEGRWVIRDARSKDWKGQARQVGDTYPTREAAEEVVPLVAAARNHSVGMTRGDDPKYVIWRNVSDRKRVQVVDREFGSREDAQRYLAEHAVEIIETKTSFGEEILPRPDKVERKGVRRRDGDVAADDFLRDFSVRGVEFGNWEAQDERQAVMNHAYDALMDLADVLGVPARALGLNGELALAFGARGQGLTGARAHYEPDYGVINLTKMKGAGSLAHEWLHALDHYFGRLDKKASNERVANARGDVVFKGAGDPTQDLVSFGFSRDSGVRGELQAAYNALIETMRTKAEQYVEDTEKADRFVADAREDVRRRLQGLREQLAAQKDKTVYKRHHAPASAEQLAAFDVLADRIIQGEYLEIEQRRNEGARSRFGTFRWSNDGLDQISAIYKAVRGRSGFDSTNQSGLLDYLRSDMSRYGQRLKMLAEAQTETTKTRKVPTGFAMAAKSIDQGRVSDYWATSHEMAARAFQSYVEDKVAEQGGRSDFLTYGTNTVIPTPWGWARPFPEGAERAAINAAFDRFVRELRTRETDRGVMLEDRTNFERETGAPETEVENIIATAVPKWPARLVDAYKGWEAGKVTEEWVLNRVKAELDARRERRLLAGASGRTRGFDWMRERLIRARRTGQLTEEQVDLALWALEQNPHFAAGLGISIREGDESSPNGDYNALARVVRIFSGKSNENTATHEILHHTERMMPADVQAGIRAEWLKQLRAAATKLKKRGRSKEWTAGQEVLLDWMLEAAQRGDDRLALSIWKGIGPNTLRNHLPYQLAAASEFWAVNAARLLGERFRMRHGWANRARRWLQELLQKVRAVFGKHSDAAVLHGLEAVMRGDGSFVTPTMISGLSVMEDRTASANPLNAWELPSESNFARMQRRLQDYLLRLKTVQDAIAGQGGTVGVAQDAYRAEERMHGRIQTQLEAFKDDLLVPLMEKLAHHGLSPEQLALYAYAKHAPERNAHIHNRDPDVESGSGMTNAQARIVLERFRQEGRGEALEDAHRDLLAITRATRRKLLDAGLISQQQFDGWEAMFAHYVPLKDFEQITFDKTTGEPRFRKTGGIDVRGQETTQALGRKSRAGRILENVVMDHERAIVRAERNAVGKVFLDLVTTNPDPALWDVDAPRDAIDGRQGQLFDVERAVLPDLVNRGDDTVGVKVGGQTVYITIRDPLLLRAMRRAYLDETGETQRILANTVGLYTTWVRNMATRYNPGFVVTNTIRDAFTGAITTLDELGWGASAKYATYLPQAWAASWVKERGRLRPETEAWHRWTEEYRSAGGTTGGFFFKDKSDVLDEIRAEIIDAGGQVSTVGDGFAAGLADRSWVWARSTIPGKTVAKLLRLVEDAGSASENAARVAAYRLAREAGKSAAEAASIAKNLTVNFNRKGEWGTALSALYVFFNASVQGGTRVVRALGNPRVQKAMAGVVGLAMAAAWLNAEMGGDDEDGESHWDKIPDHVKARNIIILLGTRADGKAHYVKIPLPYGFNVFWALGTNLADALRNQADPRRGITFAKAGVNMTAALFESFNPMGGAFDPGNTSDLLQAAAPTVLDPVVQISTETDWLGHRTAPPESDWDARPDAERYFTSDMDSASRMIAESLNRASGGSKHRSGAVDITPGTIQTAARAVGGGLGQFGLDAMSTFDMIFNGARFDPRQVPFVKSVYAVQDNRTDQARFYANRREFEREYRQTRAALKAGELVDSGDPHVDAVLQMGAQLEAWTKALGQWKRYELSVIEDPRLTAEQKRLEREYIDAQRTKLMREFNKEFTEIYRPAGRD